MKRLNTMIQLAELSALLACCALAADPKETVLPSQPSVLGPEIQRLAVWYGDTAVATGRQTEKATYRGKDASAVHRITDVWIRRDGRWHAIASHFSKLAQ